MIIRPRTLLLPIGISASFTAAPRAVSIVLPGAPRTKKNSANILMAGKKKVVKPSPAWLAWRNDVRSWYLKQPVAFRRPFPLPVAEYNIAALFYRDAKRGDSTGYYQGVADVLQELNIITDDVQLVQWDGSRLYIDKANPRVEITLTKVST